MKAIWYFDLISPFAYLQLQDFHRLPAGFDITPKPVLLGAILKHWGQIGPAEIPAKRIQTYRSAQFRAETRGIAMKFPPSHPFNPLTGLRLLAAAGPDMKAVNIAFDHVFRDGAPVDSPDGIETLGRALGLEDALGLAASPEAKTRLRDNTEEAIALGVYGVPTFACEGELFWGDDSTDMFLAWLGDPGVLSRGELERLRTLPVGVVRAR